MFVMVKFNSTLRLKTSNRSSRGVLVTKLVILLLLN